VGLLVATHLLFAYNLGHDENETIWSDALIPISSDLYNDDDNIRTK
jgi:hypothetical protein